MERKQYVFGIIRNRNTFSKIGCFETHHRGIVIKDFLGFDFFNYWTSDEEDVINVHDASFSVVSTFRKTDNPYTNIYLAHHKDAVYFLYEKKNIKKDIKVLVSSNKKYIEKTGIQEELTSIGVPEEKVSYILSGSDNENQNGNKYNTITNHWEYSALLRAGKIPENEAPEYWFMIHDTCIPGINFFNNIIEYDFTIPFDMVMLNSIGQFNIGYYRHDFLASESVQKFLSDSKGMSKSIGVQYELNSEMRRHATIASTIGDEGVFRTNRKLSIWGKLIRTEAYCPSVDLYKYFYDTPNNNHPHAP